MIIRGKRQPKTPKVDFSKYEARASIRDDAKVGDIVRKWVQPEGSPYGPYTVEQFVRIERIVRITNREIGASELLGLGSYVPASEALAWFASQPKKDNHVDLYL